MSNRRRYNDQSLLPLGQALRGLPSFSVGERGTQRDVQTLGGGGHLESCAGIGATRVMRRLRRSFLCRSNWSRSVASCREPLNREMVGAVRFELTAAPLQRHCISATNAKGAGLDAQTCAHSDADLVALIKVWPALGMRARAAITAFAATSART